MLTARLYKKARSGSEHWMARCTMPDGTRPEKWFGRADKLSERKAQQAMREWEKELNAGVSSGSRLPRISDFEQAFWASSSSKVSARTVRSYTTSWKYLREALGDVRIKAVRPADAAKFVRNLEDRGLQIASVRTHSRHAKILFGRAVKLKEITFNPFEDVRTDAPKRSRVGADRRRWYQVSREEVAALEGLAGFPGWIAMLRLTRFAALRRSEALALRVSDVRAADGVLDVRLRDAEEAGTKQAEREVPLDPLVAELVKGRKPAEYVVERSVDGRAVTAARISRLMTAALRDASDGMGIDLGAKPWHTMRDSGVNEWHQTPGISPATAAAWSGHSLDVYMATYAEAGRQEVNLVASGSVSRRARLMSAAEAVPEEQVDRAIRVLGSLAESGIVGRGGGRV